ARARGHGETAPPVEPLPRLPAPRRRPRHVHHHRGPDAQRAHRPRHARDRRRLDGGGAVRVLCEPVRARRRELYAARVVCRRGRDVWWAVGTEQRTENGNGNRERNSEFRSNSRSLFSVLCSLLFFYISGPCPCPPAADASFFGFSATSASVVRRSAATDDAFCSAVRTTLVGSITPEPTRSSYLAV